jgi:hypothetical protein
MSALLKSEIESTTLSTSRHSGHGTELFISGSAPTNCDLHAGNGVEMFSLAPRLLPQVMYIPAKGLSFSFPAPHRRPDLRSCVAN